MLKDVFDYPGYKVSEEGKVYTLDNKEVSPIANQKRYRKVSLRKNETGQTHSVPVHRIVCEAFNSEGRTIERKFVNHIDLDPTNNHKDNLDWVTSKENNIHLAIMRRDNLYFTVIAYRDGKAFGRYRNAHEALKETGVHAANVWWSIKHDKPVDGGFSFKHRGVAGNKVKELTMWGGSVFDPSTGRTKKSPIKMRHIDTGETLYFDGIVDAKKHFNVVHNHIRQAIPNGNNARVFRKQWQVVYAHQAFTTLTPEQIEKARLHGPREVAAYNVHEKVLYFFTDAKAFIAKYTLRRGQVTNTLAAGKLKLLDGGWIATYKNPDNVKKLIAFVSSPVLH